MCSQEDSYVVYYILGQLMCTAGVLIDAKRFGCSCFELCSRRKTQILASNVYQTVFRSELLPGTNRFSEISSKDTITYIHSSNYRGVLAACTQLLVPLISPKVCISISTVKYWCFIFSTQVVACYRHLASCVGGCTDSLQLREELRQTREKAQTLSESICGQLTSQLRNKRLPEGQRKEMELLWVAFSSSLELLHVDMCKVFNVAEIFSLANTDSLVQTGLQGEL